MEETVKNGEEPEIWAKKMERVKGVEPSTITLAT